MRGYSDRINHALAFAAKHHDTQVRKGLRMPYATHAANVALILARYDCDEPIVVSGILLHVVEDFVRDGYTADDLADRIGSKFGDDVLRIVLAVTRRRVDDAGVEMSKDDIRDDYLDRIATADVDARWVCAAHTVHTAGVTLADLRRTIEPAIVWNRGTGGRDGTLAWYRAVLARLTDSGFAAPIMNELADMVSQIEAAPVSEPLPAA
jgi:(p)ppGpp synthase/HD superfamily hydrolase